MRAGTPVIPFAVKLPLADLGPGTYRAEIQARDSAGLFTVVRPADFDVQ